MPALRTFYQFGMQGRSQDWNNDGYNVGTLVGEVMAAFVGETEVRPSVNAITVVPGTGLSVVVGGTGQTVFVRDSNGSLQLADYLPAQTIALAAADPSQTRIDLLTFVYLEGDGGDFNVAYESPSGTITQPPNGVETHYVARGVQLILTEGTPGQPAPAVPGGSNPLAHIQILANATSLTSANINVVVPTLSQALQSAGSASNVTYSSVDGYIAFDNVGPNQIGLRLIQPYPTYYQSNDGSIKFSITPTSVTEPAIGDPITLHATVDLAAATAATSIGSSSSLAFNAGVVFYRQRGNAGTNESGLAAGTPLAPYPTGGTQSPSPGDASISPVGCFNGAVAFNSSYNGPQTIQAEFVVMVTPGAGNQTLGGANSNNATLNNGTCSVYVDNNVVSTLTGPTNATFTWSAVIPDDNRAHVIVFHINYNGPITAQWNVWLPLSAGGGVDATKIGMVGPT